ncbi:SMP-30/gluconolactonase/LRE family protein [Shewanella donghaensis]|uniref:SMP-30/gluconolactonase/LRE family protein n=1 Tax=Shewanella donghaensis TaxID=238836 RepID=UPI001183639A|nr:SMP-30/gluconolactonase/LRE family protein [Shewanella donghaensis]
MISKILLKVLTSVIALSVITAVAAWYHASAMSAVMTSAIDTESVSQLSKSYVQQLGSYEIYDDRALDVLDIQAPITKLATGYKWLEGPVWSSEGRYLLFSDIPDHKVYKYDPEEGVSQYLADSGYSNGLVIQRSTIISERHQQTLLPRLLLMQSRSRQIAIMDAPLNHPLANYLVRVSHYQGKRLNSPNDGVLNRNGSLFFTDPPYGLAGQLDDPEKELNFQGVYRLDSDNSLTLLDRSLIYPNGIALTADERTLYVAASNPKKPAWYRYRLNERGDVVHRQLFYQAPISAVTNHGLPDGLKVHPSGLVFATGPKGIWLFDDKGKLLAKVLLPSIAANLAFNDDYSVVYVTAHQHLLSFRIK